MNSHSSNNKNNTTIRDVAHKANVSISTVSRVLNDHPHVDDRTRRAVWKIISDLDYPLSKIRGQSSKPIHTMAFISYVSEDKPAPIDVRVSGIEELIVQGAQTIFERKQISTYLHKSTVTIDQISNLMTTNYVNGFIFLGGIYNYEVLEWLQKENVPFVTAGAHAYPLNVTSVMANYIQGMGFAVNHLVKIGRKHICLVNGPSNTHTSNEKYKGLRLALSLNDLPFDDYQVVAHDSFDSESGYIATLRLLAQSQPIDAIVYADDGMALGGLKAIREAGRKIPDDIAVIGFHNYEYARFADPALTTIGFDMQRMGRIAAQRLIALMEGAADDSHIMTVPTTLIIREST